VNGVPAPASYGASPAVSIPFVQRPPLAETKNGVEPKSASLKLQVVLWNCQLSLTDIHRPRPHLIARFFEARPNQCLTCGKRFLATDEGKQKKARHLDWHFRTNQRLADAAKRGQSRSWYVDEMVSTITAAGVPLSHVL
jgi:pre-mRNA cleavage complex 2 protein Pcf11